MLEAALDRLLGAVDGLLADLDALDGDADFEPDLGAPERHPAIYNVFDPRRSTQASWATGGDADGREEVSEDEGGACEGEGDHDEREPEDFHSVPTYANDGQDQTRIVTPCGPGILVNELGVR